MVDIDWRDGATLDEARPRQLADLCAAARQRARGAIVLHDAGRTATWEQLESWSAAIAAHWSELIAPGQSVVIVGPNGLEHLLAELACWRLSAIAAPLCASQGQTRLTAAVARLKPTLVVTPAALIWATPRDSTWCNLATIMTLALTGSGLPAAWRPARPDTPCLILGTSGSSGQPRGVLLSHDNLCSQQAAFAQIWPEVGPGDRLAAYLPWHHSFGSLAERLWSLCRGAELTVVPGGGRDRKQLLATVQEVAPTVLMSVPKIHRTLTQSGVLDPAILRWAFTAGAVLGMDEETWYAHHGIPVYEGWGLTETSPSAVITAPGSRRVPGIVGTPIPGVRVGVAADHHIVISGPGVMLGYVDDPVATAAIRLPTANGTDWMLDSGDLGEWTADGLRLIGRADQVVKLDNGEKVVLSVLVDHLECGPAIRHAVVLIHAQQLTALVHAVDEVLDDEIVAEIAQINRGIDATYARIQAVWRLTQPVSCENGFLTPSHKVARGTWIEAFTHGPAFRRLACP